MPCETYPPASPGLGTPPVSQEGPDMPCPYPFSPSIISIPLSGIDTQWGRLLSS
jgi:hypothetical protein